MNLLMMHRIEDGQQNQPSRPHRRKHNRQPRQDLLAAAPIRHQPPAVSQPALGGKGEVEEDGGDAAAGDEEGLEGVGADVADVGNLLARGHGDVVHAVLVDDPEEEEHEEHGQPDDAGDDGQSLEEVSVFDSIV